MPFPNTKPVTHVARGVSDARDGTNAFKGAMTALTNLIPAPDTEGFMVPRPAALSLTNFSALDASAKGVPNGLLGVGNIVYGMIPETSGTYAGLDVPFAYNRVSNTFLPITIPGGAPSLPTSPAVLGDWTPPCMAQVGTRIMVTHPGFSGGSNPFFGWIDTSGFSSTGITGSTHTSTTIDTLSSNVIEDGWEIGQLITDAHGDIPANTTITSISTSTLDLNTTATANGTNTLTNVASLTGVVVGSTVYIGGLLVGLVETLPGGNTVVLNQPTSASGAGIGVNFSGGTSITISNAATGSHAANSLTVTGGTISAPLWGSGNTNTNALAAVPVAVGEYNGRAYYAVTVPGTSYGVVFSDPGFPCQVTNATQALNFQNGLPVTAFAGLPYNQTTGGILQGLLAFQGDANIVMITGDPTTSNIATNNLGIGVGTLAPNTICNTPMGVTFVSADGVRTIDFLGNATPPLGIGGTGVIQVFLNAVNPTRMAAAYNDDVLRISVQNGAVIGQPVQEYWYHFSRKVWSGPHTFPAALIVAYQGSPQHGFTVAPSGVSSALFSSTVIPTDSDTYVENATPLTFTWATVLLPDNQQMAENFTVESLIGLALPQNMAVQATASNEANAILGAVQINGSAAVLPLWGSVNWDSFDWGGPSTGYKQYDMPWPSGLVYKQMRLSVTGYSVLGLVIGNFYFRYKPLGYRLQAMSPTTGGAI